MYIPQLPTDNLYKFLALSGVALLLTSFIYTDRVMNDLSIKTIEAQTQTEVLKLESDAVHSEVVLLRKSNSQDLSQWLTLREKNLQIGVKAAQLTGEHRKRIEYNEQAMQLINHAIFGISAGLIMALAGFILWYLRVQKPADAFAMQQLTRLDT